MSILRLLFTSICLYFYASFSNAQNKTLTKAEIKLLVKQSNDYFHLSDFSNSLKSAKMALASAELINEYSLASEASNRIARNFTVILDYKNAIFFYDKSIDFANKVNDFEMLSGVYNNLGNLFSSKEQPELKKAIFYYKKAIVECEKSNDLETIATINMNLAWTYFENKQFDVGYKYLDYFNKNFEKHGEKIFTASKNMLNGMYFSSKNQNKLANSFFLKSVDKNNIRAVLREDKQFLYKYYAEFLYKTGDFQIAYDNLIIYRQISDSLFNEKKMITANFYGLNLLVNNYKSDIAKLKNVNSDQSKKFVKSKNIIVLGFFVTMLLLILLGLIFISYRRNIKSKNIAIKNNKKLVSAVEREAEANKMKSQFISTISHELRTPLYGVVGITNIIYEEYKNVIDSKHLDSLRFSAKYLLSLINDILQISKIEDSKITLEKNAFDIRYEIAALTNALNFSGLNDKVELKIEIDEAIPQIIVSDKVRLSQILLNLVKNALNYTKEGSVTVSLKLIELKNDLLYIKFQVKDTGVGIEQKNHEKIFDKFTQIDRIDSDYQGTGLGLSIVKKTVELFDSQIFVESEVNKGSTFSFTIGFEKQTFDESISNDELAFEVKIKLNILVVEDNKINQLVTKKVIQQRNHVCKIAPSGFDALEILKTEKFDVILMDINMPEMNGYETTQRIRTMKIEIPVIALTAYSKSEISIIARESGIDDIVEKPFETERLFEVIFVQINAKKNVD